MIHHERPRVKTGFRMWLLNECEVSFYSDNNDLELPLSIVKQCGYVKGQG